jgi:hypothetical protein
MDIVDLEYDLLKNDTIIRKCQDPFYARDLYGALCNNRFFKNDKEWTCSWRHSGGIVADLRNQGEDYLDFYCSGNESVVTQEIEKDLLDLGWTIKPYEPRLKSGIYRNEW